MTTQQPEAMRLANVCSNLTRYSMDAHLIAAELRTQHARIADLEAQLEAIGAGGESGPLIGQPQAMPDLSQLTERGAKAWAGVDAQGLREGFTAADMATASAHGFRDGVASVSAGSEPLAWKHDCAALLANDVELWIDACPHCGKPRMHATQAAHPSPPEGMAGRLQVYRCKIKSKKQIDKEIPREQQGWWADVAAGQKLLLRQAVQSDLDRCTLGGKRSRNPADYMCETENHGSLVSKVALEYMNPEQNVFAAAPGPADGESK